jgi:hypothetical protein
MLMLETMLREMLTSTNHHREFHAGAGAVTVHTTLTAVRVICVYIGLV